MKTMITGKAIVLGKNIDTDQIYPGRFLALTDPAEIGSHCLAGVDETIAPTFEKGGVVVAGTNFGCGSSREHAPIALLAMGAAVVLADSFARIFFRNAINLGLPLVVCKSANQRIQPGQHVMVDFENGKATITETGEVLPCERLGNQAMAILSAGGIKPMMRKKMGVE